MGLSHTLSGTVTLDDPALHERLDGFVARFGAFFEETDDGAEQPEIVALLAEVRDLLRAFQVAEARHVRLGLADPGFAFATAQERLGFLRSTFGAIVRVAIDGLEEILTRVERVELEKIALLAQTAPLTSQDDLEAMRSARQRRSA
jgi:hypothetical protein